jgi:hypothetical protein
MSSYEEKEAYYEYIRTKDEKENLLKTKNECERYVAEIDNFYESHQEECVKEEYKPAWNYNFKLDGKYRFNYYFNGAEINNIRLRDHFQKVSGEIGVYIKKPETEQEENISIFVSRTKSRLDLSISKTMKRLTIASFILTVVLFVFTVYDAFIEPRLYNHTANHITLSR